MSGILFDSLTGTLARFTLVQLTPAPTASCAEELATAQYATSPHVMSMVANLELVVARRKISLAAKAKQICHSPDNGHMTPKSISLRNP